MIKITDYKNLNLFRKREEQKAENSDLELTIENSLKESSRFRKWAVDTFAGTTFHQPLFLLSEMYVVDLDLSTITHNRLTALLIGLGANRAYGIFRDYWAGALRADENSSERKKFWVDTSAKVLFEAGLYGTNLAINGVKKEDMYVAIPIGLAIHFGLGRVYGKYQDCLRSYFGAKPTL